MDGATLTATHGALNARPEQTRSLNIAILAMGGEGGGVLADWIIDLAEHAGYHAQGTSVPGVAQRTGATIYYVEMHAGGRADAAPVLALMPFPGDVDVVIASELMEAGRAIQRGLVTADRTTLIASTHRVYSMTEKTAMGDGRVDPSKLIEAGKSAAQRFIAADFAQAAEQKGSVISAVLFGALAGSGRLPFTRAQFEDAIRRGGVGVDASLAAFDEGYRRASVTEVSDAVAAPGATKLGPALRELDGRIGKEFPPAVHDVLRAAIQRLADYQDVAYAAEYLDRLGGIGTLDAQHGDGSARLLRETARHLALWMSYEDTIRVADLKTRRRRFERVQREVRLGGTQLLHINEFLHPRVEEIADTLPAPLGRWLLATGRARQLVARFTTEGRIVRTSALRGFLLLYAVAALRRFRRRTLRFHEERQRIDAWLGSIERTAARDYELAVALAECQRLVKGYGDTHARGWRNFSAVTGALPRLLDRAGAAAALRRLRDAALADEDGRALQVELARLKTGEREDA